MTVLDLDRTVTRHGTYTPFLLYAAMRLAPWRLIHVPVVVVFMIAYRCRWIRRRTLKQAMHGALLGGRVARASVDRIADRFAERIVRSALNPGVLSLIARERQDGRTLVIATAAHRFYAEPIARLLGIDHVVATESIWRDDVLSSLIRGENCYGEAKVIAVIDYLAACGFERRETSIRCYSDDVSDLPLFEFGDEPIGFNPSPKLRRVCEDRGWQVHSIV